MADKEATVYIVDVGRSMGRKHQNRDETDFDWAMRYVWDKITTTVGGTDSNQGAENNPFRLPQAERRC
jgi:hypothetical protein